MLVQNSRNVSIVGAIEIDYVHGAHYQGTVVLNSPTRATSTNQLIVATDPGFYQPDDFVRTFGTAPWSEHQIGYVIVSSVRGRERERESGVRVCVCAWG